MTSQKTILDTTLKSGLSVLSALIYLLLLIPPGIIIITSFTAKSYPTLPQTIDFKWYAALLENSQLIDATVMSLTVAIVASLLSVVMGTVTAMGYVKSDFEYKEFVSTIMLLPLMISPVITGIAIIRYAGMIEIESNLLVITLAHSILVFPYVFLIIRSELISFNERYEKASRVLGADSIQTTLNVTIPIISPAMVSAYILAFVVSFGEFTATQFLVSPGTTTVPVIIYTMLREGLSPIVSSLSTVLIILMLLGAIISAKLERD